MLDATQPQVDKCFVWPYHGLCLSMTRLPKKGVALRLMLYSLRRSHGRLITERITGTLHATQSHVDGYFVWSYQRLCLGHLLPKRGLRHFGPGYIPTA